MEKKKLTPLMVVAREMAEHSSLDENLIAERVQGVLRHLKKRAADEIVLDSKNALECAQEYQAVSEMVLFFGSQLIAFEDIDADDADRIKN